MALGDFSPKGDVVEIPRGLGLSNAADEAIL
jgi:hypothetical protein